MVFYLKTIEMENQPKDQNQENQQPNDDVAKKTKTNQYTPEEKKFADGEGTELDKAIDGDETNPATRGE